MSFLDRGHPRVCPADGASIQLSTSEGPLHVLRLANISIGGAAVEMSSPPERGTELFVEIKLSFQQRAIRCFGTVAWSRAKTDELSGDGPAIGVQFKDVHQSDVALLREYVDARLDGKTR